MPEKKEKKKQALRKVRAADFRVVYSNGITIVNTARDFQFVFGLVAMDLDGKFAINEHTLVAMSPQHTKSLFFLLEKRIKDWEKAHGEIKIGEPKP